MADRKASFINFTKNGLDYGFEARYRVEDDGMYSWYIPTFDIYFSSTTKEQGDQRAIAMTRAFFNHWINEESFRSFVLQIHKLGFKAAENHELTIKRLISREIHNASFNSKNGLVPEDFKKFAPVIKQGNLAMAI